MSSEQLWKLAESMAAKQLAKGTMQGAYEAVMLYIHILREQGKLEDALKALEGRLGDAIPLPAERQSLQASLKVAF